MDDKPKFEIIKANPVLRIGSVNYFVSLQKIVNSETGNSSEHLVLKKQGVNEDGSLRGQTRQLFISLTHVDELLHAINSFIIDVV